MKSLPWAFAGCACLFAAVACSFPWHQLRGSAGVTLGVLTVCLAGGGIYSLAYGLGVFEEER